jgi:hypothetical protein
VEEFELDLDHVVEALAPLVDVVVAVVTAVHFAGGLKPPSVNAGQARLCQVTLGYAAY